MLKRLYATAIFAALAFAMTLYAQDFKIGSHTVQVHGFGSQGFAYSNNNNFLTMKTSDGSPAFTEGAVNLSMPISDKFRIGAQGYARKAGSLDDGRPQLDWAYGDYRFANWFGVRGGKVKTVMGLYNDTQDMTFLYPWALLPQGVYPADLRTTYIAHTGGDAYGRIPLKKIGKLEYTVYGGQRSYDNREGYYYYSEENGYNIDSISGRTIGGDLKWFPVKDLTLGTSWSDMSQHRAGYWLTGVNAGKPYTMDSNPNHPWVGYADYAFQKWEFSSEYRNVDYYEDIHNPTSFSHSNKGTKDWFATASYRVTPKLQVGVYHSGTKVKKPSTPTNSASTHIYDEVGAVRYDINRFWDVKAEGHFMDGYDDSRQAQGFYTQWNPQGLKPKTNMLMLRATFKF